MFESDPGYLRDHLCGPDCLYPVKIFLPRQLKNSSRSLRRRCPRRWLRVRHTCKENDHAQQGCCLRSHLFSSRYCTSNNRYPKAGRLNWTLLSSDTFTSPTVPAEQPRSSFDLLLKLCAWVSMQSKPHSALDPSPLPIWLWQSPHFALVSRLGGLWQLRLAGTSKRQIGGG